MPLIEIRMIEGRSADEKRRLLEAVSHAVEESIDAPLASIRIWIQEFPAEEYMVAGELASGRGRRSSS